MKQTRRERTPGAPEGRSSLRRDERRSPAFYATRRDIGWLVALITLVDTLVKLVIVVLM